ncbi:hypothetical protein [Sinorhizobium psoraleae]|uniref:Uncharacterized protein n=1 Tax=Sinorhizobium psoraleae TaxID=520838 RepID=A0ABT4KL35_9HYPH|nr:hypothetical protein [Sinorhizobium psoraleae]MCZ4092559.1 hypothetical protein [Sinorhizobium psoraleae]
MAAAPRILSDASRSLFRSGASPATYGAAPHRETRGGCRNPLFDDGLISSSGNQPPESKRLPKQPSHQDKIPILDLRNNPIHFALARAGKGQSFRSPI